MFAYSLHYVFILILRSKLILREHKQNRKKNMQKEKQGDQSVSSKLVILFYVRSRKMLDAKVENLMRYELGHSG